MTTVFAGEGDKGTGHGRVFARLRDRVAASDPAFTRLRLASRALLSLLLTAALLAGIAQFHPLPIASYGLAVIISFSASTAVRDPTPAGQLRTRLYAFAIVMVLVFVASVIAPHPLLADLAFLAVIFGAVYVRAYGQRWFAIGLLVFMSYFMTDYLRPGPGDIGWLALGAALAFAVTHIVTTVILADDRERDFRRALVTVDRRINLVLRELRGLARQHPGASIPDRRPMQAHLSQLREIVLMAEGFIPQGEAGSLAAAGRASELAIALFELQLSVERMVRASYIALPPADLLDTVLHHARAAPLDGAAHAEGEAKGPEVAARLLLRLDRARDKLMQVLGPRPSPAFATAPAGSATAPTPPSASGAGPKQLIPQSLHRPIQITLACAIAMGCGLLLSPVRWYWAVITAFIVFNNTKSRADTALRALQRSAGTFGGLIGGTILATLLHGQLLASAIAIPVLFFASIYFLQASYSLMIFFLTLALALLYGLMGSFTPELLVLRLEETVIGSLAGSLVAFAVFPERASHGAAAALEKYLSALADLIAAAGRRAHGEPEPLHLLSRSRLLDRAYTDLANAARPLGGPWNAVTRFGEVRERLLLLTGCAHWGRVLARSLRPGQPPAPDALRRIDELTAEVARRIEAARAIKDSFFDRPDVGAGEVTAATPRPPVPISESEDPVFALVVIATLLDRATLPHAIGH